ncbi:hypothetical protein G9A89_019193 [Geosiphon pyriformis]|nr:hypothetical protein G9A89_019193 [Geosiphon pyriformis]
MLIGSVFKGKPMNQRNYFMPQNLLSKMANSSGTSTTPTCPVDPTSRSFLPQKDNLAHPNSGSESIALNSSSSPQQTSFPATSCPVDHTSLPTNPFAGTVTESQKTKSKEEGCKSESIIDPSNLMPITQHQTPLPGQRLSLDTTRETSSIPRGITDDKQFSQSNVKEQLWIYPSEQMFFNAMKRKNWQPQEEDMAVIVPIHNAVNEKAWREILEWEKMHADGNKCGGPKLVRFEGRAMALTPKARILNWLGYKLPFDRHDWTVDRCGKQITYVIDFYSGQPDPKQPQSISFYLDVRPALTLEGATDRLRRYILSLTHKFMRS